MKLKHGRCKSTSPDGDVCGGELEALCYLNELKYRPDGEIGAKCLRCGVFKSMLPHEEDSDRMLAEIARYDERRAKEDAERAQILTGTECQECGHDQVCRIIWNSPDPSQPDFDHAQCFRCGAEYGIKGYGCKVTRPRAIEPATETTALEPGTFLGRECPKCDHPRLRLIAWDDADKPGRHHIRCDGCASHYGVDEGAWYFRVTDASLRDARDGGIL